MKPPAIKDVPKAPEPVSLAELSKESANVCILKLKPTQVESFVRVYRRGDKVTFTVEATVREVQVKDGRAGVELHSLAEATHTEIRE